MYSFFVCRGELCSPVITHGNVFGGHCRCQRDVVDAVPYIMLYANENGRTHRSAPYEMAILRCMCRGELCSPVVACGRPLLRTETCFGGIAGANGTSWTPSPTLCYMQMKMGGHMGPPLRNGYFTLYG